MDSAAISFALSTELSLPQYASAFESEGIDGPVLVALAFDADVLEACLRDELGVKSGLHRGKIKAYLAKKMMQHGEDWKKGK